MEDFRFSIKFHGLVVCTPDFHAVGWGLIPHGMISIISGIKFRGLVVRTPDFHTTGRSSNPVEILNFFHFLFQTLGAKKGILAMYCHVCFIPLNYA